MADFDGGDASVSRMRRNVCHDYGACTYLGSIANVNVTEQLSMRTEHHTITDFRVTVAGFLTGTTEGHAMQETHVVADHGGFANHNVGGVVNQETMTYFGCRVKVHAELAAHNALDHLGRE